MNIKNEILEEMLFVLTEKLDEIIGCNIDELREFWENGDSLKARPDYGYSKFYLEGGKNEFKNKRNNS